MNLAQDLPHPSVATEASPPARGGNRRRSLLVAGSLIVLALAASATSLGNGFARDDVLIVKTNARAHSLADFANFFVTSYWPRQHGGGLYRPLSILAFALQWVAGGGSPAVFHLLNVVLYVGLTLAVFGLARRFLSAPYRWLCAALFAVHPVHVEAVANVVGQSELVVGLCLLGGLLIYLRARQRPELRAGESVALLVLACVATLFKENGILLPLLLLMAELTVVEDERRLPARLRSLLPTGLLLLLAPAIVLTARRLALGTLVGEYPVIALGGLGLRDRFVAMLGLAPEWFRLLLWPAHLQADYGPPGLDAVTTIGIRQVLGGALLAGSAAVAAFTWRRRPVIAFGIAWTAVAILPVSNLPVATGILVAERTLLLASIGVAITLAGLLELAEPRIRRAGPAVSRLALAGLATILVAGAARSALRQLVWRDNPTIILQTVKDAPLSYRTWHDYGNYLRSIRKLDEAKVALERSAAMYSRDAGVYEDLGQLRRFQSGCGAALPDFERAVHMDPTRTTARGRWYLCLLSVGDTARARAVAAEGAARGEWYFELEAHRWATASSHGGTP